MRGVVHHRRADRLSHGIDVVDALRLILVTRAFDFLTFPFQLPSCPWCAFVCVYVCVTLAAEEAHRKRSGHLYDRSSLLLDDGFWCDLRRGVPSRGDEV